MTVDQHPDDLLASERRSASSRPRRGWLAASIGCVVAGALIAATSVVLGSLPGASPTPAAASLATSSPTPLVTAGAPTRTPEAPEGITALVDPAGADALAATLDIPPRAMRAYLGAALKVSEENAGCGLGWNTLAGIGHVESEHGTHGGSAIGADGVARPPIVGIPLDGGDTAAIRDTDDGALDGDTVWDRAVGPMQFIPSTWESWASDGDGDGVSDPQNIDDAALAAGRYLCAAGGDLTVGDNWIAAVAAYNDAVDYNNRVADAADSYAGQAH